MKSREELHKMLDVWWDDGLVGNLIIYRSPGAQLGDCIIERVLKCREMKPEIRAAFEMVMDELEELDEVAFVRFVSVYREFESVNAFVNEIMRLHQKQEST